MARPRLTERQNETHEFIRTYLRERGKPPTIREIGQALGLRSPNGVHRLLGALEDKGYIRREANIARGLTLAEPEDDPFPEPGDVPSLLLIGRTRSDRPETLRRRPQGTLFIDPHLIENAEEDDCLVARAGDDGMADEGILKGDFLVVEEAEAETVRPGEIAAVLAGELVLARRLQQDTRRWKLLPASRSYSAESFTPGDSRYHVVGRVVAVMRRT